MELKYEKLYAEIYKKRKELINGETEIDESLTAAFDKRREIRTADEKYAGIEVEICDVNSIQNLPKGVSGFWLRAMLGQKNINATKKNSCSTLKQIKDRHLTTKKSP